MLWFIIGFIVAAPLWLHIGWYGREIYSWLKALQPPEKEPEPAVTSGAYRNPELAQPTNQVVTPVPPIVLKKRQDEELRKLRYS